MADWWNFFFHLYLDHYWWTPGCQYCSLYSWFFVPSQAVCRENVMTSEKTTRPKTVYGEYLAPRLSSCFITSDPHDKKSFGDYVSGRLIVAGNPKSDGYNWWIPVNHPDSGFSMVPGWVMAVSVRRMKSTTVRGHNSFGCPVWTYTWE